MTEPSVTPFDNLDQEQQDKIVATFKITDPNQTDENLTAYARTLTAAQLTEVVAVSAEYQWYWSISTGAVLIDEV